MKKNTINKTIQIEPEFLEFLEELYPRIKKGFSPGIIRILKIFTKYEQDTNNEIRKLALEIHTLQQQKEILDVKLFEKTDYYNFKKERNDSNER